MILTITMNPALDKSTTIKKLVPEAKMRCPGMNVEAGGGGINVSKVIKELDGDGIAMFPSGGMNGRLLEQLLKEKEIAVLPVPIANETRENFVATDESTNQQYRFVLPGPVLSQQEIEACFTAIRACKPAPQIIIFSGSLPPEMPVSIVADTAALAKEIGARFIVDTSGPALKQALDQGVFLVKPNLAELCSLTSNEYLELAQIEQAARSLIEKGSSEVIVVSMGPSGALLVSKDICKRIPSPTVKKLSTVGAGDSMVAGMALMLAQQKPLLEMAQFGVACGTAATMNAGTQLCKKEDVLKVFDWIKSNTH